MELIEGSSDEVLWPTILPPDESGQNKDGYVSLCVAATIRGERLRRPHLDEWVLLVVRRIAGKVGDCREFSDATAEFKAPFGRVAQTLTNAQDYRMCSQWWR